MEQGPISATTATGPPRSLPTRISSTPRMPGICKHDLSGLYGLDVSGRLFAAPGLSSVAGALVLNPGGGAIASLAATGLSLDSEANLLAAFVEGLFGSYYTIGEAAKQAKVQIEGQVDPSMPRIYSILGDPAVRALTRRPGPTAIFIHASRGDEVPHAKPTNTRRAPMQVRRTVSRRVKALPRHAARIYHLGL